MEGSSVVEARRVFEECLTLIADRDPKYGSMWRTEDLGELFGNVSRKFKGIEYQWKETEGLDKEFLLDLINYTAFFLLRLRNADK
mgnify:CR=1 FL=1